MSHVKSCVENLTTLLFTLTTNKSVFWQLIRLEEDVFKLKSSEEFQVLGIWDEFLNAEDPIKYWFINLGFITISTLFSSLLPKSYSLMRDAISKEISHTLPSQTKTSAFLLLII